jgi:ubiquinone/menaquinone biosynthesis C-methylase UbiE
MAFVHREDDIWAAKAREAQGWVELHKRQGYYKPGEQRVDLKIPYHDEEPWQSVARRFDQALARLQLTGVETVLDLGAGRGWAAKHMALLGCETVALDVADDENVGLGRSRSLMDDAGVFFERVIGDGEHLPFQPESFDGVFCSAALHHATDLPLLLMNVHRVLKPGGWLCAIREPSLSAIDEAAEELRRNAEEEIAVGIGETRPTFGAYLDALRAADLLPKMVVPAPSLSMNDSDVQVWARDLGALWAWPDWHDPRRSARRVWDFANKRLQALAQRKLPWVAASNADDSRARALAAVAHWCTGELFILAEKKGG